MLLRHNVGLCKGGFDDVVLHDASLPRRVARSTTLGVGHGPSGIWIAISNHTGQVLGICYSAVKR